MTHLSDGFHTIEDIINPKVTYGGEFTITSEILILASKVEKGYPILNDYINKYYYKPLGNYFREDFKRFCEQITPSFCFRPLPDELGGGRCLNFDVDTFLKTVLITFQIFEEEEQEFFTQNKEAKNEEKINYVRTKLKKLRKEYKDALTKKEESPRYEILKYNVEEKRRREKNQRIDLEEIVNQFCSLINKILVNLKPFIDYLEKPLDLHEIATYFDSDKFILLMGESCNWFTKEFIERYGTVHMSFAYCYSLAEHIEKLKKENPNFYFKINAYNEERTKVIPYSTEDFLSRYQTLSFATSNYVVREISDEELENGQLRNHAYVEKMYEQMSEAAQYLQADWEFLAPGEKMPSETISTANPKTDRRRKNKEAQYQNIRRCKIFLDGSPYIFRIAGKNLFDGYIGYVYANGNIIFEKFYRSFKSSTPATESATYQMRFDNFLEISKMNCLTAVIESKNNTYINRISHDHKNNLAKWFLKMAALTEGNAMEEEVKFYMRNLLLENKIHKNE